MADTYGNYIWHESTPGVWRRDIDEAEQSYTSLMRFSSGTGRMHFAITGHISLGLETQISESPATSAARFDESLRLAWLWLRYENPTIASRVSYDAVLGKWQKIYEAISDRAAQDAWADSTFQNISNGQTGVEWANSDPPTPQVATLFVLQPPSIAELRKDAPSSTRVTTIRRDLVLRSPHDIIDGIGTLYLLNNLVYRLFKVYNGESHRPPLDGFETCRLSPPFRVAAAIPQTPTPAQQARLSDMGSPQFSATPADIEPMIIPYQAGPLLPSKHQRTSLTLSAAQTTALLAAVKTLNATPTHAFHAAIALAVRDFYLASLSSQNHPPKPTLRYTTYILRNERAHCHPPYSSGPLHPAAVYHSVSSGRLTVDMPAASPPPLDSLTEFTNMLTTFRDYYHSVRDDPDHVALAPHIWAASTPAVPPPSLTATGEEGRLPAPEPNPAPSVSLSSMGLVDRIITPDRESGGVQLSVHDPWVTGEELGTGLGLFLSTFRGELTLSGAYNEAWHGREEVQRFLERCVQVVMGWVEGVRK